MKRYNVNDAANMTPNEVLHSVSLLHMSTIIDWSEQEFETISNMNLGEKEHFDGITVERVQ